MREHGLVASAGGLGAQDHVCWPFEEDASFRLAAAEFLTDGRRLGQRLMYVGDGPAEKLRTDLESLDDLDTLVDGGSLQILPLSAIYPVGQRVDAAAQVAVFAGATDQALADGYSGLRVVSEVTALVTDPATWDAHTRWEIAADRYAASHPVAGICCYDRRVLPDALISDVAAVHPLSHQGAMPVPFRLFARADALALEGEIDYFSAESLDRLLALASTDDLELEIELSEVGFMDHHGVLALAGHARRLAARGGRLRIQGAPTWVRKTCNVLGVAL